MHNRDNECQIQGKTGTVTSKTHDLVALHWAIHLIGVHPLWMNNSMRFTPRM